MGGIGVVPFELVAVVAVVAVVGVVVAEDGGEK